MTSKTAVNHKQKPCRNLPRSGMKKTIHQDLKVSWTKERVGIGENELEELDWWENVQPVRSMENRR